MVRRASLRALKLKVNIRCTTDTLHILTIMSPLDLQKAPAASALLKQEDLLKALDDTGPSLSSSERAKYMRMSVDSCFFFVASVLIFAFSLQI